MAFSKMKKKATTSAKKGKGKKNRIARNAEASVDELLAAAEAATASLDVEKAIGLYSQTASLLRMGRTSSSGTRERDLVQVLEKLGEAKVSMGDQEGAKQDFQEAIQLLDKEETKNIAYYETRSSLLFYFGQLCVEQEALNAYKNGISDLESCLSLAPDASANSMEEDEATNDKFLPELRKKLSGAFCTLVELYLTDLCYEEDAENECELYLEKALQIKDIDGDPVVDALQTMASFRLSQESRRAEAIPYILRTYEKMKIGSEALASLVGLGDPEKDMDGPDEKALELTEVDA